MLVTCTFAITSLFLLRLVHKSLGNVTKIYPASFSLGNLQMRLLEIIHLLSLSLPTRSSRPAWSSSNPCQVSRSSFATASSFLTSPRLPFAWGLIADKQAVRASDFGWASRSKEV